MEIDMTKSNMEIGSRLREIRHNMNIEKAEIAQLLKVTEDHYRKLEAGLNCLTLEKILLLREKYGIDPTYLLTGEGSQEEDFDFDHFIVNISSNGRDRFFERVFAYMARMVRK